MFSHGRRNCISPRFVVQRCVGHRVPPNFMTFLEAECRKDNNWNSQLKLGYEQLNGKLSDHQDLLSLISEETNDKDLIEAANSEIFSLDDEINDLVEVISEKLVPPEKYDCENAVLEVVPGAGGQEASLFAEEILQLYLGYADYLGYQAEVTELVTQNLVQQSKGITKAVVSIVGENVFSLLKFECGVHRVQRVPITGTRNDRVQTSTCSVAVLPAPRNIEIKLGMKDPSLKWEFMRAKGAGGQGVNTTDSAVRLTHLPTNTVVESQEERSQATNRNTALKKMKSILYRNEFSAEQAQVTKDRQRQVRNMDRNEKIRTYNFHRHSVTDHRLSQTRTVPGLSDWFGGQFGFDILDQFSGQLRGQNRNERLTRLLSASHPS